MKIPYGVAAFTSLRTEGQLYVDRTDRIAVIEELGKSLLFLRPRRFGKSLWLSTLAAYYDLRTAEEHEHLFGGLGVGEAPTPLAHRYFVLEWDFSDIDPDPPFGEGLRARRLGAEIHRYLLSSLETFLVRYRNHLPHQIELTTDAFTSLNRVLAAIEQSPYQLYILIDEYDNFANEVMVRDQDDYHKLVGSDGPFKRLFKWIKAALRGPGLDRIFMTGVSPVVMSDVTSGMNMAENMYLYPEFNTLCGFTGDEVRGLLNNLHVEKGADEQPPWAVSEAHDMLRDWYNGYRFATAAAEAVYNPTLVLYFLKHLQRTGTYPRQMLDANLAADEGKLDYISRVASGNEPVVEMILRGSPLEVRQVVDRFTLREMLDRSAHDASFLGSYLYYFGMLTLSKEETQVGALELTVPNEVMRGLYVERIRRTLMPRGTARSEADRLLFDFLANGNLEPLLDFIEATLFKTFSNRDAMSANELTVKTIFMTLLWNDISYITHSEPEVEHRYADLCLLRRPDARSAILWDLLFEFKRLSLKKVGRSGAEVQAASRLELLALAEVREALDQAENQLVTYREALEKRQGGTLKLRAFAVVALGFERLVVRSI